MTGVSFFVLAQGKYPPPQGVSQVVCPGPCGGFMCDIRLLFGRCRLLRNRMSLINLSMAKVGGAAGRDMGC